MGDVYCKVANLMEEYSQRFMDISKCPVKTSLSY